MSRLFSFGFGGEDDIERDIDQEESSTEPFNAVGAETPGPEPQPHYLKDLLLALPSCISYSSVKITTKDGRAITLPRRELFDIRAQIMAEDTSSTPEPIAGLSNDDIAPNVYEGGFKTWECSVDLANYLAFSHLADDQSMLEPNNVIELGAGSALPSLLLFDQFLSRSPEDPSISPPTSLTLSDYNISVLTLSTVPNLLLTWCARQSLLPPGPNGDLEITSDLCNRLLLDLESRNVHITCLSGAWSPAFISLIPKMPFGISYPLKITVLASETIYSPATLVPFTETLLGVLRMLVGGDLPAIGLVAAKKVYFGVGGGVDEFVKTLEERGGNAKVVWESEGAGVGRVILEVTSR